MLLYNNEQKSKYFESNPTDADAIRRRFIRLEPMEKFFGKDICEMDQRELITSLKSLNIRGIDVRRGLLSKLRNYANWVRLNGTSKVEKWLDQITPESIAADEAYVDSMIGSPTHLEKILNNGLDFVNYENRSKMTKLIFLMLYEGILLTEIAELKKTDIDKTTDTIKVSDDKSIKVNPDITKLWEFCADITYIEKRNGKADTSKSKTTIEFIKYDLHDNNYLFRSIIGEQTNADTPCSLNYLRKVVAKVFAAQDAKTIPARNINYSGVFHKMYEHEKATKDIVPAEMIAQYLYIKYTNNNQLQDKTRKWRTDYMDWKIAFGHPTMYTLAV